MIELFTRFVVAVEAIAAALSSSPDAAAPAKESKPATGKAPKPETVKATEPKPEVVKSAPVFSYDTLKASVVKLANKGAAGKNAALAILAEYDVSKADKIPENLWPEANAKFEAAAVEVDNPTKEEGDFA